MTGRLAVLGGAVLVVAACAANAPAPVEVLAGAALEVRIVAKDIAFVPDQLGARPGLPLHLVLENQDEGVPHNVALMGANGSTKLGVTEIVSGPDTAEMDVPGLVPGVYQLLCEVHPNMVSTLTVGG